MKVLQKFHRVWNGCTPENELWNTTEDKTVHLGNDSIWFIISHHFKTSNNLQSQLKFHMGQQLQRGGNVWQPKPTNNMSNIVILVFKVLINS